MKRFSILNLPTFVLCLTAMSASTLYGQMVVAHRGSSGEAPENTLAAFNLAWDQDADAVEGDFYLTSDGQIACIHDATTERTGGQNLDVAKSTLADLQKLDVGLWKDAKYRGEKIVTLSDALATLPAGKVFFVEIKCGPEIVPALEKVLADSGIEAERIVIIAFDKEVIRAAKQKIPQYQAYWLSSFKQKENVGWTPTVDQLIATAKEVGADGLDVKGVREVVTAEFVKACHDASLSVHCWTIDDPELACELAEKGVESITTNRPDIIQAALADEKE